MVVCNGSTDHCLDTVDDVLYLFTRIFQSSYDRWINDARLHYCVCGYFSAFGPSSTWDIVSKKSARCSMLRTPDDRTDRRVYDRQDASSRLWRRVSVIRCVSCWTRYWVVCFAIYSKKRYSVTISNSMVTTEILSTLFFFLFCTGIVVLWPWLIWVTVKRKATTSLEKKLLVVCFIQLALFTYILITLLLIPDSGVQIIS